MKKNYQKPELKTVVVNTSRLLNASDLTVNTIGGGVFSSTIGAGDGSGNSAPRSRSGSVWGDDEE